MPYALRERLRDWPVSLAFIAILGAAIAIAASWTAVAFPALRGQLPFPQSDRLVAIQSTRRGTRAGVAWTSAEDLRGAGLAAIAVHVPRTWGLQTEPHGHVEVILSEQVTGEFFDVLGVTPIAGSRLTTREDHPGNQHRAWLSYPAWKRFFAGDRAALGRTVLINAVPYEVAGILPEGFDFPERGQSPDLYIPLNVDFWGPRGAGGPEAIARLRDSASLASLRAELAARPPETGDVRFEAQPLATFLLGDRRQLLEWLLAAVAILLAVATANASGVWIAKWIRQQRHTSIKLALGASMGRLIREQCWQAAILGAAAAAAGIAGAYVLLAALRLSAVGPELHRLELWNPATLDWRIAAALAAIAVAASVLSATAPLLLQSNHARRRPRKLRLTLAAIQLTLTATLSYCGIAVWHGVQDLVRAQRGFRTEGILMCGIGIPEERYNTDEKMIRFHQRAIEELRAIPGVRDAAGGLALPTGATRTRFLLDDENTPRDRQRTASLSAASPGLLHLLEIPLHRGRAFTSQDRWGTPHVALVNEAFVREFLSAAPDPIGHRIRPNFYNGFAARPYTEHVIVGVIGDTLNRDLALAAEPQMVISSDQMAFEGFRYFVRTDLPAGSLRGEVERAIWRVDPEIERVNLRPLSQQVESAWMSRQSVMWLLALFGAVAAAIVIFGLASSLAATFLEMNRELAIRAAIGARPGHLVYASTAWALTAVVIGWIASLPLSIAVGRATSHFDPVAWMLASAVLAAVAIAAGLWPAVRAAAIDPAETLRLTNQA